VRGYTSCVLEGRSEVHHDSRTVSSVFSLTPIAMLPPPDSETLPAHSASYWVNHPLNPCPMLGAMAGPASIPPSPPAPLDRESIVTMRPMVTSMAAEVPLGAELVPAPDDPSAAQPAAMLEINLQELGLEVGLPPTDLDQDSVDINALATSLGMGRATT